LFTTSNIMGAMSLAGGGASAYSQKKAGDAQAAALKDQARTNKIRAAMSAQQGMIARNQSDKAFAQQYGHGVTATAAGGVLLEGREGSSNAQWAAGAMGEQAAERAMIAQNASMAAWGYNTQAVADNRQAGYARRAGNYNAGGTMLESAGSAYRRGLYA
jgi:hypothetical protein